MCMGEEGGGGGGGGSVKGFNLQGVVQEVLRL